MSGGAPDALFAYGTLRVEAVVRAVLGRRLQARGAELADHARTRVASWGVVPRCVAHRSVSVPLCLIALRTPAARTRHAPQVFPRTA